MQNEASLIGPVARVSVMRARRATAKVEVRRVRHAYTNLMLLLAQLGGAIAMGQRRPTLRARLQVCCD